MLHITNGDSVVQGFREGGLPGDYLPWRDALHDGPVPETDSLEALSDIRARALAGFGWGKYVDIRDQFAERDQTLLAFRDHEEVVLWFEHDLYDQLQLIQLLDFFASQDLGGTTLSIIQIGEHPEVQPFYGLGQLNGPQLMDLFPVRQEASKDQLALGREAWDAFRAKDPTALLGVAQDNVECLPFLGAAIRRLLEEYPWKVDGLSRLQRNVLRATTDVATRREEICRQSQLFEEAPWGDASVYLRLETLAGARNPAIIKTWNGGYMLSDLGKSLLFEEADWVRARGGVDTWLGGVHLIGTEPQWRWDGETLKPRA